MYGTIISQGRFTSDGAAELITIPSDADWMMVYNRTQWATQQATGRGVQFYWQRGLGDGEAFEWTKEDNGDPLQGEFVSSGGFTLVDPNAQVGAAVTGTTITKADPPVCTANGHGYANGDVVVLSNLTEMPQLGGVYFQIGSVTTNTFELTYMDTNTANFTAESAYEVRKVPSSFFVWRPEGVYITDITGGATTSIELSHSYHGLTAGQVVRVLCPADFGMTQIDNLTGEIQSVSSNVIVLDIDSSAFTSFAWPADTAVPINYAQVTPVGTNSQSNLDDATRNTGLRQMMLGAGIDGPAGSSSDVIYWVAGKSVSVSNS